MAKKSADKSKTDAPTSDQPSMNKVEAVRKAISDGVTVPLQGVEYIKNTFGIEVSPGYFTSIKSADKLAEGARPKPKAASPAKPAAPAAKKSTGGDSDVLTALENVKELVDQLGADKVKRMVDLLG